MSDPTNFPNTTPPRDQSGQAAAQPGQFPYTAPGQGWQLPSPFGGRRTGEPYMPTQPNMDHTQWGQGDFVLQGARAYPGVSPGPWMPQGNEIPGLIHNITMGLGRYGSPGVGMGAINSGKFMLAYIKAYMAGQHQRAQIELENFKIHALQTQQRQDEESRAYSKVYALYGEKSPELTEQIERAAREMEGGADTEMINVLHTLGPDAAKRLIAWRDSKSGDLKKTIQQLQAQVLAGRLRDQQDAARYKGMDPRKPPSLPPGQRGAAGGGGGGTEGVPGTPDDIETRDISEGTGDEAQAGGQAGEPGMPEGDDTEAPTQTATPRAPTTDQPSPMAQPFAATPSVPAARDDTAGADQARVDQIASDPRLAGARAQAGPTSAETPAEQVQRRFTGGPDTGAQPAATTPAGAAAPGAAATPSGLRFEPIDEPQPPSEDVQITPKAPEEDAGYQAPRLRPLPPAQDWSNVPGINMSAADVESYAQNYLMTGRRPIIGTDPRSRTMEGIIERRANQIRQFTENVMKNIGPGHPEAVLGYIDQAMPGAAANIRSIIAGNSPIPRGYAANSVFWNTVQSMARRIKPDLSDVDFQLNQRTRIAFTTGTSYPAQTISASNRALQHSAYAVELARSLENSNYPMSNAARNWLRTQFGDPRYSNFDVVMRHVAQELTRAFRGNGGALRDVEAELQKIGSSRSPAQIAGYFRSVAHLLYGQVDSLNELWKRGTHQNTHPLDMLSPTGQQAYLFLRNLQSDYHPALRSDGRIDAIDANLAKNDAAVAAKPHSWQLRPGVTITDPGVTYSDVAPTASFGVPVWPGTNPETNVNVGGQ